eukprot:gene12916-biopygen19986
MQRWLEEIAGVYRCCGRRRTRVSAKAPPSPHPPPKPAPAKNGAAVGSFHRRKIDPLRARPPPFQGVPWSMQRAESDLSKTAPPFCWVPRRGCANNGSGIPPEESRGRMFDHPPHSCAGGIPDPLFAHPRRGTQQKGGAVLERSDSALPRATHCPPPSCAADAAVSCAARSHIWQETMTMARKT